jgi:NADH dehydrogenase
MSHDPPSSGQRPELSTPTPPTTIDREEARRPRWEAERQRMVQRILLLGGGFGGLYTAQRLEKQFRRHAGVEITLISRDNYFLMTPFLFEAGSGVLEPRHAVNPIRPMFDKVRFVEGDVERIDFDRRVVYARHAPANRAYELHYDQVVLALGAVTNRNLIPGSDNAIGFKTLSDAIFVRNSMIDLFEQADVEEDPAVLRRLLTFVIIGGGLVGVELVGELQEFAENLLRNYPRIPRQHLRFVLVDANDRIMQEMEEDLAHYAADRLWKRGVGIITNTRVRRIERGRVYLPPRADGQPYSTGDALDADEAGGGTIIEAETILLAAGAVANPLLQDMPLEKAKNGRVVVEATMRSKQRPEVWALGDCAAIPDPQGKPYPPLAQHALRQARVLADNIAAVVRRGGRSAELKPFVYETLGMLASLGHYDGVGRVLRVKLRGFLAWWVWRTYYLFQMPRFDRKLRVMMDWTIALFFRNDVVKLDLFGEEHPSRRPPPGEGVSSASSPGSAGSAAARPAPSAAPSTHPLPARTVSGPP